MFPLFWCPHGGQGLPCLLQCQAEELQHSGPGDRVQVTGLRFSLIFDDSWMHNGGSSSLSD